jgi:hypothetical protein
MEGNEAVVIPNAEEEEHHHIIALLKVERLKGDPAKDKQQILPKQLLLLNVLWDIFAEVSAK